MKKKLYAGLSFLLIAVMGLTFAASCQQVSAQDIQGLLQAMEGKEMVVTLSDGSTVRITVDDAKARAQAAGLIGERIEVQVKGSDDNRKLVKLQGREDDDHIEATVESVTKDTFVIGGKTFKVDAATILEGGVSQGAKVEVHFITLADKSLLATKIEALEQEDEHAKGAIESISSTQVVIGGKTFQITPATRLDDGLAKGVTARVEFTVQPDGKMVAIEIETDQDDEHFTGVIESVSANSFKIGGRTFTVNNATELDSGLAVGVTARVEFIKMADGSLVAKEIETDQEPSRLKGAVIESISGNTWVVGGQTFKVGDATRLDEGLQKGKKVEVRFITLPDGTKQATRIKEDRSGPGSGLDQRFTGTIDSIGQGVMVISGQTFKVDQKTILDSGLVVGKKVRVEFLTQPDGSRLAKAVETDKGDGGKDDVKKEDSSRSTPEDVHFAGAIESIGQGVMVIGGKTFKVDQRTMLDSGLSVGKQARVEFFVLPDGTLLARSIETDEGGLEPGDDKGGGTEAEPGDDKGGASGGGGSGSGGGGK